MYWNLPSSLPSCVHPSLACTASSHIGGRAFCTRDTVDYTWFLHVWEVHHTWFQLVKACTVWVWATVTRQKLTGSDYKSLPTDDLRWISSGCHQVGSQIGHSKLCQCLVGSHMVTSSVTSLLNSSSTLPHFHLLLSSHLQGCRAPWPTSFTPRQK